MSNTINIPALLESGLIEAYALGIATPNEIVEVEAALQTSAETKEALNAFEIALEAQYMGTATDTVNIDDAPKFKLVKKRRWVNYAAAAAILLLIGSSATYLFLNNSKNPPAVVIVEPTIKEAINLVCQDKTGATCNYCHITFTNDNVKIAFCHYHGEQNIPDANSQYQLWGFVDGKPVDLGVFDVDAKHEANQKIGDLSKKYAGFAITIEKKGGSLSPTLDKLVVKGNV
jgi:anti-sigma-K factor RskA